MESAFDGAINQGYLGTLVVNLLGNMGMFLLVGVAVVLFVLASSRTKEYGKVSRYTIALDEEAAAYVRENQERDEKRRVLKTCIGVFCVFSVWCQACARDCAGICLPKQFWTAVYCLLQGLAYIFWYPEAV